MAQNSIKRLKNVLKRARNIKEDRKIPNALKTPNKTRKNTQHHHKGLKSTSKRPKKLTSKYVPQIRAKNYSKRPKTTKKGP